MRKLRDSTRGAAAVEFAIIAPLLFVIVFGIIEFGTVLYDQAVITNASREAARYSSTFYTNPANATGTRPTCAQVQTYATNYVYGRIISFGGSTAINVFCCTGPGAGPSVTCSTGTAPDYDYGGVTGYVGTIRIQYQHDWLALGGLLGLSPLTLRAQTAMRDENQT